MADFKNNASAGRAKNVGIPIDPALLAWDAAQQTSSSSSSLRTATCMHSGEGLVRSPAAVRPGAVPSRSARLAAPSFSLSAPAVLFTSSRVPGLSTPPAPAHAFAAVHAHTGHLSMPVPSTSSDLDAMLEEVLTRSSPALQLAVPFDSSVLGPAEAPFPSSSSAFPGYPDPKYAAVFEGYDSIRGACDDDEDDDSDVFDVLAAPANVFVMQTPATSAPVAPNVDFATCPPAFTLAAAPESDFAPAASFTLLAAVPAVTAPVVPALMPAAPAARDRQALDQALRNIASIQPIVPVAASQPDSITRRPLSLAQLEGLNWMAQMEQTQFRGGFIDADKMQLLAYIIADRSPEQAKPNLVISNVQGRDAWAVAVQEFRDNYLDQAISQTFRTVPWEANGARSGGRSQADTLRHFDLVIVSYQTLKSQYQRERRPNDPRESPLHSIDWHRVIFDEGDFLKGGRQPHSAGLLSHPGYVSLVPDREASA
ncbi:uncharacterized protein CTHT_0062170 [Thermochaetoides thermophila DSM 1495]|uniref:SNF2 N-terminal domain-containing protein n=1 Tax=Chaetomium thermophilum (strain DSM 1495 / CBS 144.50 / IMI 039719) TaxID=759272 RepID=G0SE25_CHATD|nr:hypothetical protein CTHT_0062170 [Thermochaetoides thermophila DSM 1495]EGS18202.1 hypothetical protein CTHT_0062170 [Thermochaetoides thermophila DSM 1495]